MALEPEIRAQPPPLSDTTVNRPFNPPPPALPPGTPHKQYLQQLSPHSDFASRLFIPNDHEPKVKQPQQCDIIDLTAEESDVPLSAPSSPSRGPEKRLLSTVNTVTGLHDEKNDALAPDVAQNEIKSLVSPQVPQPPGDSASNSAKTASRLYPIVRIPVKRPFDSQYEVKLPSRELSPRAKSSPRRPTSSKRSSSSRDRRKERKGQFLQNLSAIPNTTYANEVDENLPPLDFCFVTESVLGEGVERATEEVMLGCSCYNKYRQKLGCVYLDHCSCIQDVDMGGGPNARPKRFAYGASLSNYKCLIPAYLKGRFHIYECNSKCDCDSECKNRVVQYGRQVGLEIFRTEDGRGWGLRCDEDLNQGQFIDTYRGEIITSEEANRRGSENQSNNYFFALDKFIDADGQDEVLPYVCDGRAMGGPTRFMNHSCDPNCQMHTVSYNHNDRNIYELAFFAKEFIPQGTELTFDYSGESSEKQHFMTDEMADQAERQNGYRPTRCFCKSNECRRYILN